MIIIRHNNRLVTDRLDSLPTNGTTAVDIYGVGNVTPSSIITYIAHPRTAQILAYQAGGTLADDGHIVVSLNLATAEMATAMAEQYVGRATPLPMGIATASASIATGEVMVSRQPSASQPIPIGQHTLDEIIEALREYQTQPEPPTQQDEWQAGQSLAGSVADILEEAR